MRCVRLSSPVFLNLTGTTPARSVLEAMIAHSDNTATDVAIVRRRPGPGSRPDRGVRPDATVRIPDSDPPPVLLSGRRPGGQRPRLARDAAPGDRRRPAGPTRSPINDTETMVSSAEEYGPLVPDLRCSPASSPSPRPSSSSSVSRRWPMPLPWSCRRTPPAYGKGGSIDWKDFHCFCLPGQMIVAAGAGHFLLHHQLDRAGRERRLRLPGL